ncbi:beta-N-acetylhexosaminidase [Mycolicibacterium sarraceniae]|uniref:beta-N-acetylhexosaminidase n=1 Tax=Mycolicibacterium sarraceniae TaxID=1534348 RepID=A0A7I7SY04_9MYCO|nr:family 20 glycosylhydrolase [Mycolicibacterium sarraceniae]BBY61593.1 beta-N-acetylhexosaminidase [Mycolicibacterium sarraceniae]
MPLPVIPRPAVMELADGSVIVADGMPVVALGPILGPVAQRFAADLRADTGIELPVVTEGIAPGGPPAITLAISEGGLAGLAPTSGVRADGRSVTEDADERHALEIDADGVRVWGATAEAVFRGTTTLRQLLVAQLEGGRAELRGARIADSPRFAWRGLSLDVARTFHSPETVRRVIDMCSLYKLNVLHLHLTDDQGWRVEVPSRPLLTEVGARGALGDRPGGFYRLHEIAALVAYAAERFVTVVPEIDMPGHASAAFHAYPELGGLTPMGSGPLEAEGIGSLPAISNLDPGRPEVWAFVEDVLDAVISQFPASAYVHIGGDEAFGMPDTAHATFVEKVIELVRARGRLAVGWQEIARAAIDGDVLVQYWMDPAETESITGSEAFQSAVPAEFLPILLEALAKSTEDVPRALEQGAKLLISPTNRVYLDRPHAAPSADPAQEERRRRVGLPVYPPASLRQGVEWDPIDAALGVDSDEQVAGVEAAAWGETVTDRDDLEFLLMPRLAGVGEKAWAISGATDWDEFALRLAPHATAWDRRGWEWFRSQELPAAVTARPVSG